MGDSTGDTAGPKNAGNNGATKSNPGPVLPPFHQTEAFPDAASVFGMALAPLEEVKDHALVVLDTNVLLVPYTVNSKSLDVIRATYQHLKTENRLFIPAQAAREFAIQRANKLGEMFLALTRVRNGLRAPEVGDYPLLAGLQEYERLAELQREIRAKLDDYHKSLGTVVDKVRAWRWNDPVSLLYRDLFTADVVTEGPDNRTDVEKFLTHRRVNRLAPGYKDAGKDDGGIGDALIWRTILHLGSTMQKDLIFVSLDEKPDWWHRSEKTALYPRFDLANEFWRESGGRTFHQVRFSEVLALFQAPQEVVADVQQEESIAQVTPQQAQLGISEQLSGRIRRFVDESQAVDAITNWLFFRFPGIIAMARRSQFPDLLMHLPSGERLGVDVKTLHAGRHSRIEPLIYQLLYRGGDAIRADIADALIGVIVMADMTEAAVVAELAHKVIRRESGEGPLDEFGLGIVSGYMESDGRFTAVWEFLPSLVKK